MGQSQQKASNKILIHEALKRNAAAADEAKARATRVINLQAVIRGQSQTEIQALDELLKLQGWALVRVPRAVYKASVEACYTAYQYFEATAVDEKRRFRANPQYGYHTNAHKETITTLTGDMLDADSAAHILDTRQDLQRKVVALSRTADSFCSSLLAAIGASVYGIKQDERVPLTMPHSEHKQRARYGMLDIVAYNNAHADEPGSGVAEHIDPGLFAMSFFSSEKGLQLKAYTDEWIAIDDKQACVGVLWNGLMAREVSGGRLQGGWHRVVPVLDHTRVTTWYEVVAREQVSEEVRAGGMLALVEGDQNTTQDSAKGDDHENGANTAQSDVIEPFTQWDSESDANNDQAEQLPAKLSREIAIQNSDKIKNRAQERQKVMDNLVKKRPTKYDSCPDVINVVTQQQQVIQLKCDVSRHKISDLKSQIEDILGLRFSKVLVIIELQQDNKPLQDNKSLKSYNLKSGSTIQMVKHR